MESQRPRYRAPSSPPSRGGREPGGLRRKGPPAAGSAPEAAEGRKPKFHLNIKTLTDDVASLFLVLNRNAEITELMPETSNLRGRMQLLHWHISLGPDQGTSCLTRCGYRYRSHRSVAIVSEGMNRHAIATMNFGRNAQLTVLVDSFSSLSKEFQLL